MTKPLISIPLGDKVIERIAQNNSLPHIELTKDLYLDLIEDVVSQQLSGKVATVIFNRFLELFPNRYPKPELLCSKTVDDLRSVGLSNSKALYVKNIAEFSLTEDLSVNHINSLSDEEIVELLCKIKGVGVWTAQMVLIFSLNRPDVFPKGDLAIQQGMKHLYCLKSTGKELINDIISISERWKPNRTTGTRYIWLYVNQLKAQKIRY
jgi:DNA-3-methyladenine glycosylase II